MAEDLRPQQSRFCEEYIVDLNAKNAAIRAGYSEKTAQTQASRLLSNVKVQERVRQLKLSRSERTGIDADWVLLSAKRVFDRCMQDEKLYNNDGTTRTCETESGEIAAAFTFNANGANKALETIGRHVAVNAFEKQNNGAESEKMLEVMSNLIAKLPS